MNLLDDPPQLEFICEKDGKRMADPQAAEALYFWSDAVLTSITSFKTAKVRRLKPGCLRGSRGLEA